MISKIRDLCESYFQGVIALLVTYPIKAWTESSLEVFDSIIKIVKDKKEQDWPKEIVNIIDNVEKYKVIRSLLIFYMLCSRAKAFRFFGLCY